MGGKHKTDTDWVAEYQRRFDQCEFFQLLEIRVVVGDSFRREYGTQLERGRFVAGVFIHDWWGVELFEMRTFDANMSLRQAVANGLSGDAFQRSGLINLVRTARQLRPEDVKGTSTDIMDWEGLPDG